MQAPKEDVVYPDFVNHDDPTNDERPCPRCGELFSTGYPDACLGFIPGASEACCGHGIYYHEDDKELAGWAGKCDPEGTPYITYPPDDPNYILDGTLGHTDHIHVRFPRMTDPARVKAVALAVSKALGRDLETIIRNPHRLISDNNGSE